MRIRDLLKPRNKEADVALVGDIPLLQYTVELSSEQILALDDGVEITPTPPAAQLIVPIQVLFVLHFGSVQYAPGDNVLFVSTASEWPGAGGSWLKSVLTGLLARDHDAACPGGSTGDDITFAAVGEALSLFTVSPQTDGDGTLTVTTYYVLADTA